jgi:hypothetical protein
MLRTSALWPTIFVVAILDRSKKSKSNHVAIAAMMNLRICESFLQQAKTMTASYCSSRREEFP